MPRKKLDKTLNQTDKETQEQVKKERCSPKIKTAKKVTNPKGDHIDKLVQSRVLSLSKRDIDLMLANEVVRRQFPKTAPLSDPSGQIIVNKINHLKTKRVVNKKPVLGRSRILKNSPAPMENNVNQEKTVKAGRPRGRKAQNSIQNSQNPPITINGTVEDQIEQPKKPIKLRNNRSLQKQDPVENNVTSEENVKGENTKIVTKRKLTLNRKTTTAGPKTRKQSIISKENEKTEDIVPDTTTTNKIVKIPNVQKDEDTVYVRRTSFASSELSWTKDISSSSTTTCVTVSSKDFFRIDKKLPIVKLMNIDKKLEKNDVCDVKCETQTSIVPCKDESFCEDTPLSANINIENDTAFPHLQTNLSLSTSVSCADQEITAQNDPVNKLCNILEKLSSKLKRVDLEIINWIGNKTENTNDNVVELQERLFHDNFLKEEMNVIRHCRSIKEILSYNQNKDNFETQNDNIQTIEDKKDVFNKLHQSHSTGNENINRDKENLEQSYNSVQNDLSKEIHTLHCKQIENNAPNLSKHTTFDEDEDDALSLYAESLTGIETSTRDSSADKVIENQKHEEYIPEPITNTTLVSRDTIVYEPTKINKTPEESSEDVVQVGVCEKQSADSTSIYKELDSDDTVNNSVIYEDRVCNFDKDQTTQSGNNKLINQGPALMADTYKPLLGVVKSSIFKKVCIYNLNSVCKNIFCKYSHKAFETSEMVKQLKTLNDETIVQEYMLIRSRAGLRRTFGICFVEECIKRKLTRILVEIALDFVTKTKETSNQDCAARLEVVENILLYMNEVNLSVCEDILKCNIKSGVFLCDYFMSTIAVSQNFSRFKSVFINLTNFINEIGRSFTKDVAMHVLERIVILPYDEGLALALMKIIRKTDDSIFLNPMIGHLEKQWLSSNIELFEELRFVKDLSLKNRSALDNCYGSSPRLDKELDRYNPCLGHIDKNIRYSPDTTNLDSLTKTSIEPKFKRTIDFNKLKCLHNDVIINSSRNETKPQFSKWRGKSVYSNIMKRTSTNQLMRPPLRTPMKRRSDYSFDGIPNKFQRRSGPKFF